jgi:hypothetical protein
MSEADIRAALKDLEKRDEQQKKEKELEWII